MKKFFTIIALGLLFNGNAAYSATGSKYITKKKSNNTIALEEINNLYKDALLSKSQCVKAKQKILKLPSNLKNLCDSIIVRKIHKDDKTKSTFINKKGKKKNLVSTEKYWCISPNKNGYDLIPSWSPVSKMDVCAVRVYEKDYPRSYNGLQDYHYKKIYAGHGISKISVNKVISLTSKDNIFKIENNKLVLNKNKKKNNYLVKKTKPKKNKKKKNLVLKNYKQIEDLPTLSNGIYFYAFDQNRAPFVGYVTPDTKSEYFKIGNRSFYLGNKGFLYGKKETCEVYSTLDKPSAANRVYTGRVTVTCGGKNKYTGNWVQNGNDGEGVAITQNGNKLNYGFSLNKKSASTDFNLALSTLRPIDEGYAKKYLDQLIKKPKKVVKKEPKLFEPKETKIDKIAPTIKTNLKIVSSSPNFTIEGIIKDNTKHKQGPFLEIADANIKFDKKTGKFAKKLYSPFSTQITLAATDVMGNRSEIVVDVEIKEATLVAEKIEKLNPSKVRRNRDDNKIALIIGIEKYDNVVSSSFSNLDAKYFTEYVKNIAHPKNIITLLGGEATLSGSFSAFAKQLRGRIVAGQSEVIIFFSGHGLAENESDLYLLASDSDSDLLEYTALKRDKIIKLVSDFKPKSVVMFLDTCYSGTSRKGEQLIASARPIRVKVNDNLDLPDNFSIFSASQNSELSSSMDEAKQGIFSYYLMKGLEGNADENKDREITNGELHNYLTKNVPKKALQLHSRNQNPTFTGSPDQVFLKY